MQHKCGVDICEVTCRQRGLFECCCLSLGVCSFFSTPPLTGHASSEALCCPLLVNTPVPSRQPGAGMDIWHLSITTLTGGRLLPPSPTLLPFPLSVFPPSIKTDKVRLGLISPVADNRSLPRPTRKKKKNNNYCSIIIDGNQR